MAGISSWRKLILIAVIAAIGIVGIQLMLAPSNDVRIAQLLSDARAAMERQDWQAAGVSLDQVLAQNPQHGPALLERGKLWELIGQPDNALADWSGVTDSIENSGSAELVGQARYLMGMSHLQNMRARQAEQCLAEAWERNNKNLTAVEILLRLYVLQMRAKETRWALDRIETLRPLSLEEMVLRVDAGLQIIDELEAVPQLEAFVKKDPEDVECLTALGRYLLTSEKLDELSALLKSLTGAVAKRSDIQALQVMLAARQARNAEASQALLQRPTDQPTYLWWFAAGEFAHSQEQYSLAANCFQVATQLQPDAGTAHYKYGIALEAAGEKARAERELNTAAELDRLHQYSSVVSRMTHMAPAERAEGLLKIARSLKRLDRPKEAVLWANLALEVQPQNSEARELKQLAPAGTVSPDNSSKGDANTVVQKDRVHTEFLQWIEVRSASLGNVAGASSTPDKQAYDLRLVDVHAAVGLEFQYFNGNSGSKYLIEAMGGGIGVIDFDNDGWPDCHFPQGSRIPHDPQDFTYLDQLYRNVDGQRFVNVTAACRIIENGYSQGVAVGDLNNDGFSDLVVANFGRSRIFVNQGDGTFIDATDQWGLQTNEMSTSVALSDLDLDGALDLYLVNYVDSLRVCRDTRGQISTCNPQNFTGVQDRLFRNSGDGQWIDVTQSSGVIAEDGKGLGVVATDLDSDGLVDLFVANDSTPNFLFKNLGNMQFREIGLPSGTALSTSGQAQAGMGIAAADFNGDLLTDLVVTNFFEESSNLYINHGDMIFTDEALPARIKQATKEMVGFGVQGEDFDLDGNLDLIMANGHIDDFSYRGEGWKMKSLLFRNRGQAVFDSCGHFSSEYFDEPCLGRGVASLDWNRDGKKDVIIVHQDRPVALLENRTNTGGHSLRIKLIGRRGNRDAIGAMVTVTTSTGSQRRSVTGSDGFYATGERTLVFGLAGETEAKTVEIVWPGGRKDSLAACSATEILVVEEN